MMDYNPFSNNQKSPVPPQRQGVQAGSAGAGGNLQIDGLAGASMKGQALGWEDRRRLQQQAAD